ncbi:MAG: hypothetical protein ACPGPD_09725, partial [Pseudomonadales bacterium]
PGTSARLLDIKQAIVKAKNMDRSASNTTLEFDLAIQNAATNEVYDDENMILSRGTRVIIRRVAGLVHLDHADFIRLKLKARDTLGGT